MSRGSSGRIVIEIDPQVKDQLYVALIKDKLTLKEWFLLQCDNYLSETYQPSLFSDSVAEKGTTGK